jgi:hypothetical protein
MPAFNQKSRSSLINSSSNDNGKESFFGIQAKLNIGKSNDKYEVEADRVADKIVSNKKTTSNDSFFNSSSSIHKKNETKIQKNQENEIQEKPLSESITPVVQLQPVEEEKIQKKCDECESEEKNSVQTKKENNLQTSSSNDVNTESNSNLESKLNSSKSSGSTLQQNTKTEMESGFGTDFSNVKIHTDSTAVQMNKELGAQAFANGNDIYFNEGKYNPNSQEGKHLLAHELTHTVQQTGNIQKKESNQIQRSWLGDAWDTVTDTAGDAADWVGDTASDAADWIGDTASDIGSGLSSAWSAATTYLGGAAASLWSGLQSLGNDVLSWLSSAGSAVWDAILWFGDIAWDIITEIGTFLWEKLSILGTNIWSFITNIPSRFWRIVVHSWDAITGILGWMWDGLSAAAGHIWDGIVGFFSWIGDGIMGGLSWIGEGISNGFSWAIDFISNPSLSKLWDGLVGTLDWVWDGISGFAEWGWDGVVGAVTWAWEGIKGFASWIWDGVIGGLEWAGRLLLYVLDLIGLMEGLQILWGLIFRMRHLTGVEIAASLQVHPAGMIPYHLVWVDEGSLVAYIAGYFSGGGYRAVTTGHVLHVEPGEDIATMVHELSHVAQYEHAGSVYMAEAIHAQAFGQGYNYMNSDGTFKHEHFNEFNREQQASICEDYYKSLNGLSGGRASSTRLQPLINEMRSGKF